jgi:uncharacterized membrane protein YfcA
VTLVALGSAAFAGLVAGVLAGLFGIGGGAILVPLLYVLLEQGTEAGAATRTVMAHASSLAIIVPTALSALLRYQASNLVPWRVVAIMGGAAAIVSAATTLVTPYLPELWLRAGFAIFLIVIGGRMMREPRPKRAPETGSGAARGDESDIELAPETPLRPLLGGGSAVGFVASALGVGGGTLAIPILLGPARVGVRRVAAASMGVVALASIAGTIGYMLGRPEQVPTGAIGYVFVPGVLVMAPGAIVGARWGAALNVRIAPDRLRRLFALLLLTIAARIVLGLIRGA